MKTKQIILFALFLLSTPIMANSKRHKLLEAKAERQCWKLMKKYPHLEDLSCLSALHEDFNQENNLKNGETFRKNFHLMDSCLAIISDGNSDAMAYCLDDLKRAAIHQNQHLKRIPKIQDADEAIVENPKMFDPIQK